MGWRGLGWGLRRGSGGAGQGRHRLGMLPVQFHGLEALVVEEFQEVKGVALEVDPVLAPNAAAPATPGAAACWVCLHLWQVGRGETLQRRGWG